MSVDFAIGGLATLVAIGVLGFFLDSPRRRRIDNSKCLWQALEESGLDVHVDKYIGKMERKFDKRPGCYGGSVEGAIFLLHLKAKWVKAGQPDLTTFFLAETMEETKEIFE